MSRSLKMTAAQSRVLQNLVDGRRATYGLSGQSEYGGFAATLASLIRRGWIENGEITEAGRQALTDTQVQKWGI